MLLLLPSPTGLISMKILLNTGKFLYQNLFPGVLYLRHHLSNGPPHLQNLPFQVFSYGCIIIYCTVVDDTTLMAESEEELKSLLMKVKVESEKVGLKLKIQKTKTMASGPPCGA